MKLPRRQFLQIAVSVVTLPQQTYVAAALDYPSRPIRIIVGIPAGLAPDVAARLVGPPLSARFGQPVVVENRPGAGGVIGAQAVASAPPDGNTLLLIISGYAASAALYPNLALNFSRDIAPVAFIGTHPLSWRSIRHFQLERSLNSSLMPRPIRARSTWRRPVSGPHLILPVNCST